MNKSRFSTNIGLYSELMQDRAIITMEGEQEIGLKLSNGTILKWPWVTSNPDLRSRYYSTSSKSKTVQDRATMSDQ